MKLKQINSYYLLGVVTLVSSLSLQQCKPAQTTASSNPNTKEPAIDTQADASASANSISYDKQIKPIMLAKCTPCHFPAQGGFKKSLDSHQSTKENIKEILTRVMLPVSDEKSMPFKEKKPRLTSQELQLFAEWLNQGMPK